MNFTLYTQVALTQDLAKSGFKAGDVATLVDFAGNLKSAEQGCVLEVFNAVGKTINVVVVPQAAIRPLSADEILTTRPYK